MIVKKKKNLSSLHAIAKISCQGSTCDVKRELNAMYQIISKCKGVKFQQEVSTGRHIMASTTAAKQAQLSPTLLETNNRNADLINSQKQSVW